MPVRAKFMVTSVEGRMSGAEVVWTVQLFPVDCNGDPGGNAVVLNLTSKTDAEQFQLGKEMYLDFSPAPERK